MQPESIAIWGIKASFCEVFLKNSDKADEHLVRAKDVLNSSSQINPKDQAVFEHYTGYILQNRDNNEQAITHFKTAYDLDPRPFRKDQYEKALKWAAEEDESEEPVNPV
ncbi:MAG: hypothetical protein ISS71_06060 [Phycisphaerae bacterium]|nr:hypothetical protein [Phycisphaerae bacterium]